MIEAFTGPSKLTPSQRRWVAARMATYEPFANTWRSGCAFGVDTVAVFVAFAVGANLELFIPCAPHNATMVFRLGAASHIYRMEKVNGNLAAQYRHRNTMMVTDAERLHAFVRQPDFYRSGEWMTINIAKRLGVDVIQEVLPA